ERVRMAGLIHDVGKLHVPPEIVHKPARLTDDEFEQIKLHSTEGARMVDCLGDAELTAIVRHHHERFDGRGYPDGLAGDNIPIGSQIIAVADTFDAIIAPRPYRPGATHKVALEILQEEEGKQLSPPAVEAFMGYYSAKRGILLWALLASPAGRRQLIPTAA